MGYKACWAPVALGCRSFCPPNPTKIVEVSGSRCLAYPKEENGGEAVRSKLCWFCVLHPVNTERHGERAENARERERERQRERERERERKRENQAAAIEIRGRKQGHRVYSSGLWLRNEGL